MNYCDKIHYSLLTASPEDFPSMIDSLLSRLPEEERILRLVLFGTPVLKDEYVTQRQLFKAKARHFFGDSEPALSYVLQPVPDAPLVMEVHSYRPESDERFCIGIMIIFLTYCLEKSRDVSVCRRIQGDDPCADMEQRSVEAFRS